MLKATTEYLDPTQYYNGKEYPEYISECY